MKRIRFLAMLLAAAACGCATQERVDIPVRDVPGPWVAARDGEVVVSESERARCQAVGGTITQTGFVNYACTYPAPDAGKACTDASECVGKCLAPDDTAAGAQVVGQCSALVNRGGCANFLVQGKASGMLCVD